MCDKYDNYIKLVDILIKVIDMTVTVCYICVDCMITKMIQISMYFQTVGSKKNSFVCNSCSIIVIKLMTSIKIKFNYHSNSM